MTAPNIGAARALVTILGSRLGIGARNPYNTSNAGPGTASLILDGYNVVSPPNGGVTVTSANGGIVALAGGGATSLTPVLGSNLNRITTVATTSDSVQLPPSIPGMEIFVCQEASLSAAVFPNYGTTDIINALTTGVSLALGSSRIGQFFCVSSGYWRAFIAQSSLV